MWDLFISHATEDKDEIARPLAKRLRELGLEVWYDEFSLTLGDSLRESIDKGLSESRFGVVIFSKNFFSKDWPKKELNGLFAREEGTDIILPIWHKINKSDIIKYSPILADRVAVNSNKGLDKIIEEILKVINPQTNYLSSGKNTLEVKKVSNPNKTAKIIDLEYYPEMIEDYFIELEIKDYSRKTIKSYKSIINEFYEFLIKEKVIYDDKILLRTFKKYMVYLKLEKGNKQNSIHKKANIIKNFFEFFGIDILNDIQVPERIEPNFELLNKQEVADLINIFDNPNKDSKFLNLRNKLVITLICTYGFSTSEIAHIPVDNVDLINKSMIIPIKNREDRKINFNDEINVLIEKYMKKRQFDNDFLLTTRSGNQLSTRSIQTIIKKYAKEAGIKKDVNPRILRYSFEEHHQKRNMDIKTLKNIYDNARSI